MIYRIIILVSWLTLAGTQISSEFHSLAVFAPTLIPLTKTSAPLQSLLFVHVAAGPTWLISNQDKANYHVIFSSWFLFWLILN